MKVTVHGRLKPNKKEFIWLQKKLHELLVQRFGICSRGQMAFAMLSSLYGYRYTRLMWNYKSRDYVQRRKKKAGE